MLRSGKVKARGRSGAGAAASPLRRAQSAGRLPVDGAADAAWRAALADGLLAPDEVTHYGMRTPWHGACGFGRICCGKHHPAPLPQPLQGALRPADAASEAAAKALLDSWSEEAFYVHQFGFSRLCAYATGPEARSHVHELLRMCI